MVIARNRTYLLFGIILILALTKGIGEVFNIPVYILILVPFFLLFFDEIKSGLIFPKFVLYRLILGLFIVLHGGPWDIIIGFTYILTSLILSLFYTLSLKDDLSRGTGLVRCLFFAYLFIVILAYLISPKLVFVLDRGIDLRFAGFAGDPNFLAIVSMLVLFVFFKKGLKTFFGLIIILLLTQSRTSLIVLALLFIFTLKKRFGKFILPVILSIAFGLFLLWNTDILNSAIMKLRLDKIVGQSRVTNLWLPVFNTIDFSDLRFWLLGCGSHYSKNILGVYLHSSWLEIFVEYGIIGISLAVLELKSLWMAHRKKLSRVILLSFVIVNMLFSIHWGVFSLFLLSLSLVIDRNEIYN